MVEVRVLKNAKNISFFIIKIDLMPIKLKACYFSVTAQMLSGILLVALNKIR